MAERAGVAGAAALFDALAADYDRSFAHTRLGRWLREEVWRQLARRFPPGGRVLELGAGTGEDAIWLARRGTAVVATDASTNMLALARTKAERAGLGARIAFHQVDWSAAGVALPSPGPYDGVLADFGVVNCVADRRRLAATLAAALRPGACAALVMMGPVCAWEIAWRLAHGEPRGAFRRLRAGASARLPGGGALPLWYPSPVRLAAELAPWFRPLETRALGVLLPPTDLAHLVDRWPRLWPRLATLDRRIAGRRAAVYLADHYLSVFERAAV